MAPRNKYYNYFFFWRMMGVKRDFHRSINVSYLLWQREKKSNRFQWDAKYFCFILRCLYATFKLEHAPLRCVCVCVSEMLGVCLVYYSIVIKINEITTETQ